MATAISINKYIYSILSNDEELKKMVGKNIYPLVAEDSATFPFIIFKKNSVSTQYTKDGRLFDQVEFTILIIANKYLDSVEIAERVRELIELTKDPHFQETRLASVNEDFMNDSFILELSFITIIR